MNKKLLLLNNKILLFVFFTLISTVSLGQTTLFQFNFENGFGPNIDNVVGTPEIFQSGVPNAGVSNGNACGGNNSLSGSEWNIGDYYLFIVNTTGYENMTFSYCNSSSNNNIGSFLVLVSSDLGATTSTIVPSYTPTTSNVTTTSITLPPAANNNGEVWIAIYKDSNPDRDNRTLYIDNASLRGCPIINTGTLSGNQYICGYNPATTQFSSTVSGGTWTSSDTSVATVNSSSGLVTTTTKGGSATITYTVGSGSCAKTATRIVYIAKAPSVAPTFSGTSSTLQCQNSTAIYSINALAGASGYVWATSATGWTIAPASDGLSAVITFGANAVDGNFSVKATNGCDPSGSSASPVTSGFISVRQPSFGGSIPATASGCAGDYIIYLNLTSNIGNPIRWESSNDNFVSNVVSIANTNNGIDVNNLSQTTYYRAVVQNSPCTNIAYSNVSTITINPKGPASVSIAASSNPICSGTSVTFTATPTNGGSAPIFQWKLNGANVGTNSATYNSATLANGNTITCVMTSNSSCATGSPATSNTVTAVVNAGISAPTLGTRIQPTCSTATGTAVLNGLPSGSWVLTRSPGNVITTGAGTSTTISGLSSGTYTYSVIGTNNGTGLKGEYFNNMTLSGTPALTRTDATVDFDWVNGNPGTPINNDNFSVRWSGQIQPLYSQNYIFTTRSDDGIRLWINGIQIINNWTDHSVTTNNSASIALIAGVKYVIVLEYYENGGQAVSQLFWSSASQPQEIIPKSQLYPALLCSSPASANVVIDAQPATPSAPLSALPTHPTCIVPTGSIALSGLPTSGSWTITTTPVTPGLTGLTGTGDRTTVSGLTAGTSYTFSVSNGTCISPLSSNISINPIPLVARYNNGSWTNGPPAIEKSIVFEGNYTSPGNLEGCDCTVNAGVQVTVQSGHTLKITNAVKVNTAAGTSLTFQNTASLVQVNDDAVNTGVISYIRSNSTTRETDYTYWSSPVAGQKLIDVSPKTPSDFFYSFNAADDNWNNAVPSTVMGVGTGYIIRGPKIVGIPGPNFHEATFKGTPNNGKIELPGIIKDRSYLLGNPYPSALNANRFINDNSAVLDGTLYFWTHMTPIGDAVFNPGSGVYAYSSNDYATYNLTGGLATNPGSAASQSVSAKPTGEIAAGQAFFTSSRLDPTNNTIVFNNRMRLDVNDAIMDNSQFFKVKNSTKKTNTIEKHRVWLNLTNTQGAFKQMLVGYITGATNDYDSSFDGPSYNGNEFIDFYSISDGEFLAIQGRTLPFDENDFVALGYSSAIEGDFSISIDEVDGLLVSQNIYLEDKLNNSIHNLTKEAYTFTTAIGTFDDRFVLRYTDKTLGVADLDQLEDRVIISKDKNELKIKSATETIKRVTIFDLLGKKVFDKEALDETEFRSSNVSLFKQMGIVKVTLANGQVISKKVAF